MKSARWSGRVRCFWLVSQGEMRVFTKKLLHSRDAGGFHILWLGMSVNLFNQLPHAGRFLLVNSSWGFLDGRDRARKGNLAGVSQMRIFGSTHCLESGEPPGLKTQIPSPSHYRLCRIFGISEALVVPLLLRGRQGCPEVG